MTPQAWRIYHNDAVNKTELTSSPTRVKKAREAGLTVVELVELEKQNTCEPEKTREFSALSTFLKSCQSCRLDGEKMLDAMSFYVDSVRNDK